MRRAPTMILYKISEITNNGDNNFIIKTIIKNNNNNLITYTPFLHICILFTTSRNRATCFGYSSHRQVNLV